MKRERLPVILLTGFLGSGKTTLLNKLLRDPAMSATAVLVNEFGEVGIDQALIQQACGEVVLLENGCMCCTVREGLAAALIELAEKRGTGEVPAFERIIIETTGLADPIPIIQLIVGDNDVAQHYGLLQVLTVVDATCGMKSLDAQAEAMAQVTAADCIWISKPDIAADYQVEALGARLAALSPAASVLCAANPSDHASLVSACGASLANASLDRRLGWSRLARSTHGLDCVCCVRRPLLPALAPATVHGRIQSTRIIRSAPLRWDVLGPWLEMLMQTHGEKILRLKGIVCIEGDEDRPWAIHGVQGFTCAPERLPAWPGAERLSRLVLIVRDFDGNVEDIESSLAAFERG